MCIHNIQVYYFTSQFDEILDQWKVRVVARAICSWIAGLAQSWLNAMDC